MKKINKKILILSMSIIFLGHFSATTAFSNYSSINIQNLTVSQKAELITNLKTEIKKLKLKIKKLIIDNKFEKYLTYYSVSDNNTVLYTNHNNQIIKTNIDLETISILGRDLAKDKDNVYYEGKIWKNADSETFEVIDTTYNQDANSRYAKDKNNVYVDEVIIKEADLKTFRLISTLSLLHNYSMDKNNVYYYEKKLSKEERKEYMNILKEDLKDFKKNLH